MRREHRHSFAPPRAEAQSVAYFMCYVFNSSCLFLCFCGFWAMHRRVRFWWGPKVVRHLDKRSAIFALMQLRAVFRVSSLFTASSRPCVFGRFQGQLYQARVRVLCGASVRRRQQIARSTAAQRTRQSGVQVIVGTVTCPIHFPVCCVSHRACVRCCGPLRGCFERIKATGLCFGAVQFFSRNGGVCASHPLRCARR